MIPLGGIAVLLRGVGLLVPAVKIVAIGAVAVGTAVAAAPLVRNRELARQIWKA